MATHIEYILFTKCLHLFLRRGEVVQPVQQQKTLCVCTILNCLATGYIIIIVLCKYSDECWHLICFGINLFEIYKITPKKNIQLSQCILLCAGGKAI